MLGFAPPSRKITEIETDKKMSRIDHHFPWKQQVVRGNFFNDRKHSVRQDFSEFDNFFDRISTGWSKYKLNFQGTLMPRRYF